MELSRRELLGGLAMAALSRVATDDELRTDAAHLAQSGSAGTASGAAEAARLSTHTLRAGRAELLVAGSGALRELRFEREPLVDASLGDGCPELRIGGARLRCIRPVSERRTADSVIFEYRFERPLPLRVTYEVGLRRLSDEAVALVQQMAFVSERDYGEAEAIELRLPRTVRLSAASRRDFAPLRQGVARRSAIPEKAAARFHYKMAGGDVANEETAAEAARLAVPVLGEYADASPLRISACSEPAFSTLFQNATESEPGLFAWRHTAGARRGERVARTFHTIVGRLSERQALLALYDTALTDVKPGPDWLRDIVLVHYDYLSKNGRGWFADIDTLSELFPPATRHKVVVTLHGWYDFVGRYAFDPVRQALDTKWTAFPNVASPAFLAHATGPRSQTARFWGWRKTLATMRPVEMTLADMHRRIRYAKARGFRCVLYFGDGVNSGDGLAGIHDPSKVLAWGGWIGPETSGRTYSQNPLHPDVRAFYKDYLRAVLTEFRDIDGLVWDETFHVRAGQRGTASHPGYADAAMLSLVHELRQITEQHNGSIAFLSSDCLDDERDAPYGLVSHGTYQDTMSNLKDWQFGLFPNMRNTLWSCNWYHQSTWDRVERSVSTYAFPVAVSNGFGDDTGPSDMTAEQKGRVSSLVGALGDRKLALSWIEEVDGRRTYEGRPVFDR